MTRYRLKLLPAITATLERVGWAWLYHCERMTIDHLILRYRLQQRLIDALGYAPSPRIADHIAEMEVELAHIQVNLYRRAL